MLFPLSKSFNIIHQNQQKKHKNIILARYLLFDKHVTLTFWKALNLWGDFLGIFIHPLCPEVVSFHWELQETPPDGLAPRRVASTPRKSSGEYNSFPGTLRINSRGKNQ